MSQISFRSWLILYISFLSAQADFYNHSTEEGSNLYYELFGKALLASGHWELVTWVDFQEYSAIYKYLLSNANKLQDFCASTNTQLCKNRCDRLHYELERINIDHESVLKLIGVSKSRVKRFWSEAAVHLLKTGVHPIEPEKHIYSINPAPVNIEIYNKDLDNFENTLNEVENHPDQRRTFFRLEKSLQWWNKTIKTYPNDEQRIFTSLGWKELQDVEQREKYLAFAVDKLENELKEFNSYKNKKQFEKSYISILKCDFEFFKLVIFLLSTFNNEQANLLEAIRDANNGKLNSYILSPTILVHLLQYIQFNVPEGLSFPYYAILGNAKKLHRIIKPSAYMYNNKIIIELKIPLVESDPYKIYRLKNFRKIPLTQEYDLEAPYLVVDWRFKEYQLKSVDTFTNFCKKIEDDKYLCREIQAPQVSEYTTNKLKKRDDTNGAGVYYAVGGGTIVFIICISSYFTYRKMYKEKSGETASDARRKEKFLIRFTLKKDDRSIRKLVLNNSPSSGYNARQQQIDERRLDFCSENNFDGETSEQGSNIYESPRTSSFIQELRHLRARKSSSS